MLQCNWHTLPLAAEAGQTCRHGHPCPPGALSAEENERTGDSLLFRQMKYFAAVADCKSFTEAAEQCYISQSAISQQIRALEKELGVELILSDQRRAFSSSYANFQLLPCGCSAELSVRNPLSGEESVELDSLKRTPCILISSKEQQRKEQEYYQNTLGFGGKFLFAESLEEGRLMVAGNRGFLPVESVGTLPYPGETVRRIPIVQNGQQLMKNYCVFWVKKQTNYYIEEFAEILRGLLI